MQVTIPDVPESWQKFLQTLLLLATLVIGVWNREKVSDVQEKQRTNSVKLDEAKSAADDAKTEAEAAKMIAKSHKEKVETKLDALEKKADATKAAVDRK